MNISKLVTFVLNIVLAALCCFAIVGYAAGPVWKIEATVKLNQAMVDKIEELMSSDATIDSKPYVDALREMANDDVKLPVTLSLSSKSIYGSIFAKDNSPAEKLIDDAVDAAFNDKVVAEMEKFKKSATKSVTKVLIKQSFDRLSDNEDFKNEFGDKTTEQLLQEAGVDDKTIDEKIETVYSALTSNKTIDEASDKIVEVVADVFNTVKNSKIGETNPEYFEGIDVYNGELKDTVAKTLVYILNVAEGKSDLTDSNGVTDEMLNENLDKNFDLSSLIDKYLLQLVNKDWNDANISDGTENTSEKKEKHGRSAHLAAGSMNISFKNAFSGNSPTTFSADSAPESHESVPSSVESAGSENTSGESAGGESTGDAENTIEEIKASVKQKLKENATDEVKRGVVIAMKAIAVVLFLYMSVWVYLLVKLIVNTVTGKMSTKLKCAVIFGWGPALFLVLIPTIVFKAFTTNNFITQAIFANNIAALESLSEIVTISFSSGTTFALIATVLVIAISIPYMIFRKK
ncbi:MAG: hypothetical protein MR844_03845 [Clostridia bacterium]|nr:hypothetical protein [Clostridia bacterium]